MPNRCPGSAAKSGAIRIASRFDPGTDDRVQIVRLGGDPTHEGVVGHILSHGSFPDPVCPECRWILGHALACSHRRVLAGERIAESLRETGHGPNGA